MSENKTKPTDKDVAKYLKSVEPMRRQEEGLVLLELMQKATQMQPVIWGENLIGFGQYHYHYKSGRQGDYFLTGFSPRKSALSIYIIPGFKNYGNLLKKLGKHKHSVSCLYVTRLDHIDLSVLSELIYRSVEDMKSQYPHWSS